jgi:cytochrome c553
MKERILAILLAMVVAAATHAGPPASPSAAGERKNTPWPAPEGETLAALRLKGDAKRGEEVYEVCVACHLPSGAGHPDGRLPQLAGQHSSVLIKQMADIRAGVRDNPAMYPFAATLTDPQQLADVAAYIEQLCIPVDHGRYAGQDAGKQRAIGRQLYAQECKQCHGANGEGRKDKFYPVIAGQHYQYLLRQMSEIRDGLRRNAHPEMVRIIKQYEHEQLAALSAYQSSLVMPGKQCKARAAAKKR